MIEILGRRRCQGHGTSEENLRQNLKPARRRIHVAAHVDLHATCKALRIGLTKALGITLCHTTFLGSSPVGFQSHVGMVVFYLY